MNEDKFRCHFSIVLENVFSTIWFIVLLTLGELTSEINNLRKGYLVGADLFLLYILLGIIVIAIIISTLFWRKTYISIEGQSLVIEKNTIISKKNNTISLKSISNVNLEQNFFERLIGTYKIKLDTNSSSTSDSTDVKIVLKKDKADKFKEKLINVIEDGNNISLEKEKNEDMYSIKYSLKEVVGHAFYSMPISFGVYGGVILSSVILEFINEKSKNSIGSGLIGFIFGVIIIVIPLVYSLLKSLLKFYGFKVGRKDNKIYISYGLLTKREYTIPVDKINAVIVDQPTISRIFKRKNIELVNIGMGDDDAEAAQVLLSEKYGEYEKKLKLILPELELNEVLERQSKSVFYLYGFYLMIHLVLTIGVSLITTSWFMLYIILPVIYYVLKYITWGMKMEKDYLATATGIFRKRTKYIRYNKVQNISIHQGPISKKNKVARMNIFILSSLTNRIASTGYYKIEEIEEINEKI